MKIHILSDGMASRIAAGEVVERPASVVKELIENSLDAGATEISIWIEKSGAGAVHVTDNGEGMEPEDLALAVERHATSKLGEDEDLSGIRTLGFRGEALPSIGAVARMAIVSRTSRAAHGYRLRVEGGKRLELVPAAAPAGTKVEIRDLFYNTPARRKFLKAPATELTHICDAVNRMALAYPEVHFRLQHDGRLVADYVAVSDGKDRLHQVLGGEVATGLVPFRSRFGETALRGYLSAAPVSYPNSRYLYTFVNQRFVRDKVLTHAVLSGYESLLMKGQYPAAALFLQLPFADVDVNVHPAKHEIRFRRQSDIHQAVAGAVREALKQEAKGPAAAGSRWEPSPLSGVAERFPLYGALSSLNPAHHRAAEIEVYAKRGPAPAPSSYFSSLQVLGQVFGCYLVCSTADGLVLVDQHAAHERVAFENLRRQLDQGRVESQSLLIPQSIDLSAGEMMLVEEKRGLMAHFGFGLEPFGPHSYAIVSVPALLPEGDYAPIVRQMIAELAEVDTSARLRRHLEERLATLACHSVIRANRKLEFQEMRALLEALDRIDFATQCPHGRPVLIQWSRDELERLFKRIV